MGVTVRTGTTVVASHGRETVDELALSDGSLVACAHVLVGVGVRPAVEWLAGSGLDPRGVLVDAQGRTAIAHVFAAGDAACTIDARTGRPASGGHWEGASRGGAAVADALLGRPARPPAPASFWTDQHGVRLACVGDPRDATERTCMGDLASGRFELDHVRDGCVTAVVLVDRPPSALRAARARLKAPDIPDRSAA
jgi:NADPH-dependent 2,4-dienoyl-CoA reductase/sulfur reductase-like enzyme